MSHQPNNQHVKDLELVTDDTMSSERYEPGSSGYEHRESSSITFKGRNTTQNTSDRPKGRLRGRSPSPAPRRSASPGPSRSQALTSSRRSRSISSGPDHRASQHRPSQSSPDIIRLYRQWLEAQGGAYGKGQTKAVHDYLLGGHIHVNCCLKSCTIEENLHRISQNLAGDTLTYGDTFDHISRNLILETPILTVAIFIQAELPRYVRPERDNVELNLYLEQVDWTRYIRRKSFRPLNTLGVGPDLHRLVDFQRCSCSSVEECALMRKLFASHGTKESNLNQSNTFGNDNFAHKVNFATPASLSNERRHDNPFDSSVAIPAPSITSAYESTGITGNTTDAAL